MGLLPFLLILFNAITQNKHYKNKLKLYFSNARELNFYIQEMMTRDNPKSLWDTNEAK